MFKQTAYKNIQITVKYYNNVKTKKCQKWITGLGVFHILVNLYNV